MKTRKKSRVDEKFWNIVTGLVAEKTGETKAVVLERIAERATGIQSLRRLSSHKSTNLSSEISSI
ncbi:MAG: hypothetical protein NTW68_11385 [candidate division NC10 bacterium]|nr:hypothetical protein [candidate division NC10 bacterium]